VITHDLNVTDGQTDRREALHGKNQIAYVVVKERMGLNFP